MLSTTSPAYAAAVGLIVLGLSLAPVTGRAFAQVVTLVHELGHAAMGLAVGGRVQRVSIALDASGETLTLVGGRFARLRLAAFTLAGYPAPAVVGLVAAVSVSSEDHRLFILLAAVLIGAALVLWVRNPWGIAVFVATAVLLWITATEAGDGVTRSVTLALAWLFSLGAMRSSWQLTRGRPVTTASIDDATRVAQLTRIVPRIVVVTGFVAVAAACLLGVAVLLLRPG